MYETQIVAVTNTEDGTLDLYEVKVTPVRGMGIESRLYALAREAAKLPQIQEYARLNGDKLGMYDILECIAERVDQLLPLMAKYGVISAGFEDAIAATFVDGENFYRP